MKRRLSRNVLPLTFLVAIFLIAAIPVQAGQNTAPLLLPTIASDDFNTCALNTGLWTFVDPVGDSSYFMNGQQIEISVPAGTSHDIWSPNESARIIQPTDNVDFVIEIKFESDLTERYQIQGLLIEQDADDFIRFDFYSDGSKVRNYAATFTNGSVTPKKNTIITAGNPLYLRVTRAGDLWTQDYSYDGQNWTNNVSFTHALSVNQVGPFAGNFQRPSSSPPAHTAIIDYFFNSAAPIVPEDPDPNPCS